MIAFSKIRKTLENISDAFHGSYSGNNEEGISYREIYERSTPVVGRCGMLEDKKNFARDMNSAIRRYEQEKK